jgi:23S rRNA pseudouridine955/2504/2580 synthase
MSHKIQKVTAEDDGQRLDRWCKSNIPAPYGLIQKLLRKGAIKVDGKKAKADVRLKTGQEIRIPEIAPGPEKEVRAAPRPPTQEEVADLEACILYEDKHVLVINKPAGLATQGGTKVRKSLDVLAKYLPGQKELPRLVHRLDKDTSGVVMMAKSKKEAQDLTNRFKEKTIQKVYWALVVGVPKTKTGKITLPLSAKAQHGEQERTMVDEENGKAALTYYHVIENASRTLSWVALFPATGRMHQLRAHMTAIGHPILGDGKYGGTEAFIDGISNKMHLHARRIIVPKFHDKTLDVTASLPKHMEKSWELFGWDKEVQENPFASLFE